MGFALEDRDVRRRAEAKLIDKGLDMVIANSPAAIGASSSSLQIKTRQGPWIEIPRSSKAVSARKIIRLIERTAAEQVSCPV